MDAKTLLSRMTWQLYNDIRFVAENNPTQVVDDDGTKSYNGLLARAKRTFPSADPITEMEPWNARTVKYKDALLATGQLASAISAFADDGTAPAAAGPPPQQQAPRPQQAAPPPPQQQQHAPPQQQAPRPQPAPQPVQQRPSQQAIPRPQSHADVQRQSRGTPGLNDSLDIEENDSYDSELYGPHKPPSRNNDGTIPFTLD